MDLKRLEGIHFGIKTSNKFNEQERIAMSLCSHLQRPTANEFRVFFHQTDHKLDTFLRIERTYSYFLITYRDLISCLQLIPHRQERTRLSFVAPVSRNKQ